MNTLKIKLTKHLVRGVGRRFFFGKFSLLIFVLLSSISLQGEGTKQVSPTENDWVMLSLLPGPLGQSFAGYGTLHSDRSLHIAILDDAEEVYIGLSQLGAGDHRAISTSPYEFRIVDSIGRVVHGPHTLTPGNLNGNNYHDIVAGPDLGTGTGYDVSNPIFHFRPPYKGDFSVEFKMTHPVSNVGFLNQGPIWWDFTVVDAAGTEKPGRMYSKGWKFRTTCDGCTDIFSQPFKGRIFVLTDDGFVHSIDFKDSGFRGLTYDLAFNRTGPGRSGDYIADRRSVNGANATYPMFDIFMNDPDPLLYNEPQLGAILDGPNFINPGQCDTLDTFCFEIEISQAGSIEMILDLDGPDTLYTPGTADLVLGKSEVHPAGVFRTCIEWDGRDGLGNPVDLYGTVPTLIEYTQGEIHFMMYDVEYNNPGYKVEVVHPASAGIFNKLYYDDTGLASNDNDANLDLDNDPSTGVNPPLIEINGCETPCHIWNRNMSTQREGYGESNTINSWWNGNLQAVELNFSGFCAVDSLVAEKRVLDIANAASGVEGHFDVTFEISVKNAGTTTYENISLTDDPAANFGAAFIQTISNPAISGVTGTPVLPNIGNSLSSIFDGTSGKLNPGDALNLQFTLELNPGTFGPISELSNQAVLTAVNQFGNTILDLSDDPDDPTSDDDPTIVSFPKIGLAKHIVMLPALPAASGVANHFDVTYEIIIENLGHVMLANISLLENLSDQFGAGFVGIASMPQFMANSTAVSPGGFEPQFAGTAGHAEILDRTANLHPGEKLIIRLTAEVAPGAPGALRNVDGNFLNQAVVSADFGNATVTDLSDEGTNATDNQTPAGTNSGTLGDTGGSDDPTQFPPPPLAEICNNGIDDDGDGNTDCDDSDCSIGVITVTGDCNDFRVENPQPDWTYQWYRDGVAIQGAVNAAYSVGAVSFQGYFKVEITNAGGCIFVSDELSCCKSPEISVKGK